METLSQTPPYIVVLDPFIRVKRLLPLARRTMISMDCKFIYLPKPCKMTSITKTAKICRKTILFIVILFISTQNFAQGTANWRLEKMPVDLETDYALSALPPHLRNDATVYLLDPQKGYYVARQGSNGYICFISRTDWEWGEFRDDVCTPISYDAEGARSIFPVYMVVAAMRASGKYQAAQIKDSMMKRIITGVYKAPSPGISYMLAPVMRVYPAGPDVKEPITISMPHYMLYAPYLADENTRYKRGTEGLTLANPGNSILGDGKSPFGYVIIPASETEKAIIMEEGKELLRRLATYKAYFKTETGGMHHGAAEKN
jgi:hypothetical protein